MAKRGKNKGRGKTSILAKLGVRRIITPEGYNFKLHGKTFGSRRELVDYIQNQMTQGLENNATSLPEGEQTGSEPLVPDDDTAADPSEAQQTYSNPLADGDTDHGQE